MNRSPTNHQFSVTLVGAACIVICVFGCARDKYRRDADCEAYRTIAEHNCDTRWQIRDYDIDVDPRSRFHDPYSADCPPMPPDDPSSHVYMHCVDGRKGWSHWHDNGTRQDMENPAWLDMLPGYVELTPEGAVKLNLDSALQLAYVHSPSYQSTLEELYLSSLDVTTERFRLDTQFFGGIGAAFDHDGGGAGFFAADSNRLNVTTSSGFTRRFASAGQLAVNLANSFAWEFSSGNFNFASSILSAGFVQPLLRGAGRDVALEQLTIVERALLANVRAFYQYRQGFFTNVAIGEEGVQGPQRRGGFFGGTGLTGFTGQGAGGFGGVGGGTFGGGFFGGGGGGNGVGTGFAGGGAGTVGGFIGLLQQLQQIRNTEDSLDLQLRTLSLLESHLEAGVIDLVQVDQFRQSIETERATLLQSKNSLENTLEGFKIGTLGLPPNLPVELQDDMIQQFQLVAPDATELQNEIAAIQSLLGDLPDDSSVEEIQEVFAAAEELIEPVNQQLENIKHDLDRMRSAIGQREQRLSSVEKRLLTRDRAQLGASFAELEEEFESTKQELFQIEEQLNSDNVDKSVRKFVVWLGDLYRFAQSSILVQARARLEAVTIEPIELNDQDAFQIALSNRLDFMNARASLVDSWRLIQFNADALQSDLTLDASASVGTLNGNAFSFDSDTATARFGIQFDAPFTRLLERNNYRQSLIDYQRSRRGFIQAHDSLQFGLRSLLRQIEQLRINLEIQRRAVAISIRRVDLTREELNQPVPPPQPGAPPAQFGPTAATSLLTALSDLRNTQNNFMSVWLNYYAARIRLARELGLMQLDPAGRWIELPLPTSATSDVVEEDIEFIPPDVSEELRALNEEATPESEKDDSSMDNVNEALKCDENATPEIET